MSNIEQVKFSVWQITQVGSCTIRREDLVVSTPDNQGRRLALTEERLELRVERDVTSIILEQIKLDVFVAGPVQKCLIMHPVVRIDARNVLDTIGVLKPGGGR